MTASFQYIKSVQLLTTGVCVTKKVFSISNRFDRNKISFSNSLNKIRLTEQELAKAVLRECDTLTKKKYTLSFIINTK